MTCLRYIPTASPLAAILIALTIGCNSLPAGIPKKSTLVADQAGPLIFLAAGKTGTVYVYDSKTGRIIYTTPVDPTGKLLFWPEKKQILLNGYAISRPDLDETHVYRLYFHEKDESPKK